MRVSRFLFHFCEFWLARGQLNEVLQAPEKNGCIPGLEEQGVKGGVVGRGLRRNLEENLSLLSSAVYISLHIHTYTET